MIELESLSSLKFHREKSLSTSWKHLPDTNAKPTISSKTMNKNSPTIFLDNGVLIETEKIIDDMESKWSLKNSTFLLMLFSYIAESKEIENLIKEAKFEEFVENMEFEMLI